MMLNWDSVWNRVSRLEIFRNFKQNDFRYSGIGKTFSLSTGQTSAETPIDFPALSIVLGIALGVSVVGQDGITLCRDLSMCRITLAYPGGQGNIITNGPINAAAIFGPTGQLGMPPAEIIVGSNGTINTTIANLSTSSLTADICFHAMICKLNAA